MSLDPTTDYPTSIDSYPDPAQSTLMDADGFEHDLLHQLINDALEAVLTKLGIDGSSDVNSIDYLLKNSNSSDPGHVHSTSAVTSGTFDDARISQSSVTQHEGAIDHDNLTNYVIAEHIDWTQNSGSTIDSNNLPDLSGTYQSADDDLTDIAALTHADGNFIVSDGVDWVTESGATARTSLGLGSIATQDANNVSITGGSISGITDLAIVDGGTGASTASSARTNLGLEIGSDVQAYDADLSALAGISSNGVLIRTGAGSAQARTITGTSGEISVTNGDGVSGDPTLAIADQLDLGGNTSVEIPNSTSPTVNAAGEIAVDTDGDNSTVTQGTVKYHDGTNELTLFGVDAYPTANDQIPVYKQSSNKIEWATGGGGGASITVNQTSHGFSAGDAIYLDETSDWAAAKADNSNTLGTHVVSEVVDSDNFTAISAGPLEITSHGFGSKGEYLYVSESTAGDLTTSEPGTYSNPIGIVVDTNNIYIFSWRATNSHSTEFELARFFVEKDSSQSIPNSTITEVTFPAADEDNLGGYDNGNDTYTIQQSGSYVIAADVGFASDSGGNTRTVILRINGSNKKVITEFTGGATNNVHTQAVWEGQLDSGDEVTMSVRQDSGGNLDIGTYNSEPTSLTVYQIPNTVVAYANIDNDDGWTELTNSASYQTTDTIRFSGVDLTDKISVGDGIQLTQPTDGTKSFYAVDVTLTSGNTDIELWGSSKYDLDNESVTNVKFSKDPKNAVGFLHQAYPSPYVPSSTILLSSTGDTTVSGLPFRPTRVEIRAGRDVSETSFGRVYGGYALDTPDGIENRVDGIAVSSSAVADFYFDDACIASRSTADGSVVGKSSVTSFTDDGFVINTTTAGTTLEIYYIAYA